MATQTFETRVKLKYGTWAEWNAAGAVVLLKGELGICEVQAGHDTGNGGINSNRPVIMFKVGDGTSTFASLPWASATAADVYAWAKDDYATFTTKIKSTLGISSTVAADITAALANHYTKAQVDGLIADVTAAVEAEENARKEAITGIESAYKAADAAILGTASDTADKNTVYGAKAAAAAANTAAGSAQTAADAAQAAAEGAQSTANSALSKANTAQGEVDALEQVVATKADASALNSYYTKNDADGKFATIATTNGLRTDVDENTAAIATLTGTGTGSITAQVNEAKQAASEAKTAADNAQEHSEGVASDLADEESARAQADTALGERIDGTVTRIDALETASSTHATKTELNTAKSDLIGTSADASSANTINAAKKYADEKIAAVVDGAPDALNTLNELAAALIDNADIVEVLEDSIATKANQSALDEAVADIATLEGASHSHENKAELDKIASGDKSKWDTAAGKAHEHANKTVLDGIDADDITNWNKVANKADSATVTAIDTRLTTAEGTLATATSDISTIKTDLSKKALASELDALEETVSDMDTAYKAADATLTAAVNNKADKTTVDGIDTRVAALEEIDHTHSNKTVLDGITSTKVSNWDTAATNNHTHSNKAELDKIADGDKAKWDAYATSKANQSDLDSVEARVEALETMTLILDCGGPTTVTHTA